MLSYLHGYHAGNAADALKHATLAFCLEYMKKKETPFLCVDTHAGAGFYDLPAAPENREWEKGVGLLIREAQGRGRVSAPPAPAPSMIAAYLAITGLRPGGLPGAGERFRYPGSPAIMAGLLRKGDRLVCFELHPREMETLRETMAELRKPGGPSIETRNEDGRKGLRSLLPPPSRRGLVLVDPSWEDGEEYESVPRAVAEGLGRFPEGTFIVWYPLLAMPKQKGALPLGDALFSLAGGRRCRAELYTSPRAAASGASMAGAASPRGMYGSGLAIYNPPWTLRAALEEALPYLAEKLGGGNGGSRLDWEE